MSDYASSVGGVYQAPCFGSISPCATYEPAGDSTPGGSNGTNLPDYVTFCLDCHKEAQFDPDRNNETVKAINWGGDGDRHGGHRANDCTSHAQPEADISVPYSDSANSNYVLSCLDCHEPHGTKKRFHLIRRMINGQGVAEVARDSYGNCNVNDWLPICERCHWVNHANNVSCSTCHFHGAKDDAGGVGTGCRDKPLF